MNAPDLVECTRLFVYGTLKQSHRHAQHQHLARHARFLGTGITRGHLYRVDWYPALVDADDAEAWVTGEIYDMLDDHSLLCALDAFEGFDSTHPENSEYRRVVREVHTQDGTRIWCQLYLYQRRVDPALRIASGTF